jgi:prepilin-type N-terminal cleavage/methylation domain-containing protein
MKRIKFKVSCQNGFTLVEVIVTIIAVGILAGFFIHFMGTALDNSWKSVALVAGEAETEGIIEEIIAYYTSKINSDPDTTLNSVYNYVDAKYGSGKVPPPSIATMVYIDFSSGNEVTVSPGTSNNLKVSIEAPNEDNPREIRVILTKSRSNTNDPAVNY